MCLQCWRRASLVVISGIASAILRPLPVALTTAKKNWQLISSVWWEGGSFWCSFSFPISGLCLPKFKASSVNSVLRSWPDIRSAAPSAVDSSLEDTAKQGGILHWPLESLIFQGIVLQGSWTFHLYLKFHTQLWLFYQFEVILTFHLAVTSNNTLRWWLRSLPKTMTFHSSCIDLGISSSSP